MKKSQVKGRVGAENGNEREGVVWEMRPGGMLVQKREEGDGVSGPGTLIKIRVSHGSSQHDLSLPAQFTFGELKRLLAQETGLEPREQRLLFRGKEREDHEWLHMVGVKDMAKILLMQDPASKERKLDEMKRDQGVTRACEAINKVRAEVNKLAKKVTVLESSVRNGTKVVEKEFNVLTELLMVQLLNLDGIEAEGEAKVQRRIEVRRVQNLVETLDSLKAGKTPNAATVSTKWETFESGLGSLQAPAPLSSSRVTQDWEQFD
ncbi:hypothetical protein Scep_005718 [Stephania cephalantha]|uniref:BAG family molecular chaperone regulator 4 n=1 Tax=Stephania cephalantha TaxID=152367 RepID=A0AAP0PYG2_9MAGN